MQICIYGFACNIKVIVFSFHILAKSHTFRGVYLQNFFSCTFLLNYVKLVLLSRRYLINMTLVISNIERNPPIVRYVIAPHFQARKQAEHSHVKVFLQ